MESFRATESIAQVKLLREWGGSNVVAVDVDVKSGLLKLGGRKGGDSV